MQAFHYLMFTFTSMHLADAFIQSDIWEKKPQKWTVLSMQGAIRQQVNTNISYFIFHINTNISYF